MHLYYRRDYLQASRPKESVIDRSTMLMQSKKPLPVTYAYASVYKAIKTLESRSLSLRKKRRHVPPARSYEAGINQFSILCARSPIRERRIYEILEIILPLERESKEERGKNY